MLEVYTPALRQIEAKIASIEVVRDVRYGSHPRNVLDVYLPPKPRSVPAPIVLYCHGGGYFAGDKAWSDGLVYANVGPSRDLCIRC